MVVVQKRDVHSDLLLSRPVACSVILASAALSSLAQLRLSKGEGVGDGNGGERGRERGRFQNDGGGKCPVMHL